MRVFLELVTTSQNEKYTRHHVILVCRAALTVMLHRILFVHYRIYLLLSVLCVFVCVNILEMLTDLYFPSFVCKTSPTFVVWCTPVHYVAHYTNL